MYKFLSGLLIVTPLLAAYSSADAQPGIQNTALARPDSKWSVGFASGVGSSYIGSTDESLYLYPVGEAALGSFARLSTYGGLALTTMKKRDFSDIGQVTVGASLGIAPERDEGVHTILKGMGDINLAPRGTLELQIQKGAFSFENRLHLDLRRNSADTNGIAAARFHFQGNEKKLNLSVGPNFRWGSEGTRQRYWGVTAAQSASSAQNHAAYNLDAGLVSYGAGAEASYRLSPNLVLSGYVDAQRLSDDLISSPLVKSKYEYKSGVIFSYSPKF